MTKQLPMIAVFGALFFSLANIVAGASGLGPALQGVTGLSLWPGLTAPLALLGMAALILWWLNGLFGNQAGMILYALNLVLAPFGYLLWGLPLWLGLGLAVAPLPFYHGLCWLSDRL